MNPLFLFWLVCVSLVTEGALGDFQDEHKTVELFRQTSNGYEKYIVNVK